MGINNNKNNLKNKYLKTLHFSVTQSQAPHLFNWQRNTLIFIAVMQPQFQKSWDAM